MNHYKGKKECDFVVVEFDKVTQLIQVSYQMNDEETRKQEVDGLLEAEWNEQSMLIHVLPAWKWMLG